MESQLIKKGFEEGKRRERKEKGLGKERDRKERDGKRRGRE